MNEIRYKIISIVISSSKNRHNPIKKSTTSLTRVCRCMNNAVWSDFVMCQAGKLMYYYKPQKMRQPLFCRGIMILEEI